MPEAIIKVGAKKPPEPGKKRWKLITPDNVVYQVNSDIAPLFVEGDSYKIYFEHQEFNDFKFKVIVRAPASVPDISTGATEPPTYARPRAAKEDEEGVNRRHRLNWVGERLDAILKESTITYTSLRPLAGIFEDLYDSVSEGKPGPQEDDPRKKDYPAGYKTPAAPKANAYTGRVAPVDSDLDDEIPFN